MSYHHKRSNRQQSDTYGLRYKSTLQRSSDNHVLGHRAGTDAANPALTGRVVIEYISCSVPHQNPNISQLFELIVCRAATKLTLIKRSSGTKNVTTEKK